MGTGFHGGFGDTAGAKNNTITEATAVNASNIASEAKAMPNCEKAITPKEKFINYSLDKDNPNAKGKAVAYEKGLGYTKENSGGLIIQIHNYVVSGAAPYEVSQSQYGTKYKYRIPVTGPNGKTKNVIAVYQIDKGQSVPRLITNYLEGK